MECRGAGRARALFLVPKLGIRAYLLIALGALSAVPTLVLGTVTASRASRSELERADRESRSRAQAIARELDALVSAQTASIEMLAGQVEVAGGLGAPNLQAVLSLHRIHSPLLSFTYIADREGTSLYADPPVDADGVPTAGTSYRDRDYYRALLRSGRTVISGVQLGKRSGAPNVQIVAPIRDRAGSMVGFAEGSIDLDGISESIAHAVGGAPDSRIVVADGGGKVLADSGGRLDVLTDISATRLWRDADGVRSTLDENDTTVRVATATMSREPRWRVTAMREQSSVEALADAARRDALVIMAGSVLLALLVVAFGVQWLSRPIRALAATTKAVGRGDFSRAVPIPRPFEAQEVVELLESVRDMTRDVRNHRDETSSLIAELESVNDKLRTMVVGIEHAGNPIEVVDAEGRLIYVNPAWEKFTGYPAADAIGQRFVELLSIDRSFLEGIWGQLVAGVPWCGTFPCRRRDGKRVEVELDAVPVVRFDGVVSHVVATRVDISQKRRAEEVLRMNDRLAAVGLLAAGVAHEINNPLAYITANLAFLRSTVESLHGRLPAAELDDAAAAFEDTQLGVQRVTNIVRDLKQLSRPDEQTASTIDINALLSSCVRMASVEIRHHAVVERAYGDVPRVVGNEARLSQVFLNLLINAAHACSGNGKPDNQIRVVTRVCRVGQQVVVEITDTGTGIEPGIIEHIFDPFFTTKPIGVGTGLGLSICHGIVTQLGGTISVDSSVGEGTTFRISLPMAAAEQPAVASPGVVAAERLRILVVDDEPSITQALSRMLRDHEVSVAHSAAGALTLLADTSFDVVMSDVMMPQMDGFELYRRACAVHPSYQSAFLFMTGGVAQPRLQVELERVQPRCLHKPFTASEVMSAVAGAGGTRRKAEPPISEGGS
jgi:PAS domain S-box-containing protein